MDFSQQHLKDKTQLFHSSGEILQKNLKVLRSAEK